MAYRIGVDVGGSFTDFAVYDEDKCSLATLKVFSRPDAPGEEIKLAMERMAREGDLDTDAVGRFVHGTTVGINTVIQRAGPAVALLTTRNFEDVLEVARLKIPQIHNLYSKRPDPLIAREMVFGVSERVKSDGSVLDRPQRKDLEELAQHLASLGVTCVVISFLNAYRNGDNEREVATILKEAAPELTIVTSSDTWPIIREYERTLTTVMSGYVRDRVSHYLDRFEDTLSDMGVKAPVLITKSNGGVMALDQARKEPVQMLLSGTASGVIGAGHIAKACGYDKVLTLDIGGTSADVALLLDGKAQFGTGELVGDFPLHMPTVAVSSVGQGGGSIARVDDLGLLQVGPESAGSTPGPVCYGRGGDKPTVTDAMAAQNLIGHGSLGYGAVTVDHQASGDSLKSLAERLNSSIERVAASIIDISISSMFAEVQALVFRFGIDPREFHIFAFGGGGPMLAAFLARELDVAGVVIPPRPGVVSAFGSLVADLRNDFIHTLFLDLSGDTVERLRSPANQMMKDGREWLLEQGFQAEPVFELFADMRYRGQSYEIETPLGLECVSDGDIGAILSAFHAEHERLFDHSDPNASVQLISLRLVVIGKTDAPPLQHRAVAKSDPTVTDVFPAYFDGKAHETRLFQRDDLAPGHALAGPAIIAQDDTTTILPPDFVARVDPFGNLILTRKA